MDVSFLSSALLYYKRADIQHALVEHARDKEIAIRFGTKGYGKRPDALIYPRDVLELAKNGATSFHCSEELWKNPLSVGPSMSKQDADSLRKGWDLVLDIDCKEIEYARVCARVLVDVLQHQGITHPSIKFSGNNGFHIGVPFDSFPPTITLPPPVNDISLAQLFPDGPRRIALYLTDLMRDTLREKFLATFDINDISKKLNIPFDTLVKNKVLDPYEIVKIDTVLISPRHLYRMPYSLHEKSGLASIPILPSEIETFTKEMAQPKNVVVRHRFLDSAQMIHREGEHLLQQAFEFTFTPPHEEDASQKEFQLPEEAIIEAHFPPCIQHILSGLTDGKKRGLFILVNFLKSCGWSHDAILARVSQWNTQKNPEPLREVILQGHLRHHKTTAVVLPPSCLNKSYYIDMGVCHPDNLCSKIKNPVQYAKRKAWAVAHHAPKRKKKTETPDTPHSSTDPPSDILPESSLEPDSQQR